MRRTLAVVRCLMLVVTAGGLARAVGDAGAQDAPRAAQVPQAAERVFAGELAFDPAPRP